MKKNIFTVLCLLTCGASQATSTLEDWEKLEICGALDGYQIKQDTGREDILGKMIKFNVIKNSDVKYALVGSSNQISAKKQFYCELPGINVSDCLYGTGNYSYWESEGYAGSNQTLVRDWIEDGSSNRDARDFHYKPINRGTKFITGIVTEKEFKVKLRSGVKAPDLPKGMTYEWPQIPYLHNYSWLNNQVIKAVEKKIRGSQSGGIDPTYASIPMCDVIKVNTQSAPTISKKSIVSSATNGRPITASVNYTYDRQYSYAALNEVPLTFTWTFKNTSYSGIIQTVTTNSPSVSFFPEYSGEYKVTARVNDGTFNATSIVGNSYYKSGGRDCPPNGGSGCQQPF